MKEVEEMLEERANKFLKEAEDDLRKGFFDLASFHAEQALQLKLKAFLAKKIGYFSKTHRISELLAEIKKLSPTLSKRLLKKRKIIEELELSYLASRYFPIPYSKETANKLVSFVKNAFKLIEKHAKS